jgi:hypothetical protein
MIRPGIAILLLIFLSCFTNGQTPVSNNAAVPYSSESDNMWLSNNTAADVVSHFLSNEKVNILKISPFKDFNTSGYQIIYTTAVDNKPQKFSVKVTSVNVNECVSYYEKNNPEFLQVIFQELRDLVGYDGFTMNDYKKVYNQYKHLGCKLYRKVKDEDGTLTDEMSLLLNQYRDLYNRNNDSSLASVGQKAIINSSNSIENNKQNYWINFLNELSSKGYITLIEYNTVGK